MKSTTLLITGLLVAACGGSKTNARDPASEQKLVKALARWDEQSAALEAKPKALQKKCEIVVGDCLLTANQKRDEMVFKHSTDVCRQKPDSDAEARCVADELVAQGQAKPAADYYSFKNICLDKMLACTNDMETKLAERARQERVKERRADLYNSGEALALDSEVAFAKESVNYLRSTLPPRGDGACKEMEEFPTCEQRVKELDESVEAALGVEESAYSLDEVLHLYEAARTEEASCYEPEFACLKNKVKAYGATYHTEKLLQRNLDSLETRAQLVTHMSASTSKQCLDSAQAKYAPKIIKTYQIYAKQTVMFFRSQLHRAFLSMHQDQVACLKKVAGPALTARATGLTGKGKGKGKKKDCPGQSKAC